MAKNARTALDEIDVKILQVLQDDARLPNTSLADTVGLSPSPCLRRVKLLEEGGVIEGYRAILNRAAINLKLTVFAGVKVERHSHENADKFVKGVLAIPEVVACHLVSGEVDFLIEAVVPDVERYESTVLRRLLAMPTVRDVRTSFAMRTYKAGGILPLRLTSRS